MMQGLPKGPSTAYPKLLLLRSLLWQCCCLRTIRRHRGGVGVFN